MDGYVTEDNVEVRHIYLLSIQFHIDCLEVERHYALA